MAEKVLCAIPVQQGRLFRLPKSCALVVTERRTMLVPISRAAFSQAGKEARSAAQAEGKGFFGKWGAQISAMLGYTQRFLAMDPDVILREHPTARVFENADLVSIKVEQISDEDGNTSPSNLVLRARRERLKVQLQAEPPGLADTLRQAYGDRFRG